MSKRYVPHPFNTPLANNAVGQAWQLTAAKGKRGFTKAQLNIITTAIDYVISGDVSDKGIERGVSLRPEERLVLPAAIDALKHAELSAPQKERLDRICDHYCKTERQPAKEKVK